MKLTAPVNTRIVEAEDFFRGPGLTILKPDEILTEILIPNLPENSSGAYIKLMRRNAMDLALVGVAVFLRLDGNGKTCREARVALGAVAPTPMRAATAESVLVHKNLDDELIAEAGKKASQDAKPIDDIRASKTYRTEMIKVLTKRAIMTARKRINETTR